MYVAPPLAELQEQMCAEEALSKEMRDVFFGSHVQRALTHTEPRRTDPEQEP